MISNRKTIRRRRGPAAAARLAVAVCLAVSLAVSLAAAPTLAATGRERSNDYFEEARGYIAKGNVSAAVIQLKNALQSDPGNVAARYLLGEIYLRLGNGASAEKELSRARDKGIDETRIIVSLLRAYMLQGKYDKVLDEAVSGDRGTEIEAAIMLYRGQAHLGLGRIDEAEKTLRRADSMKPDSARTIIALARVFVARGDGAAAEAYADRALRLAPKLADSWVLKGELRRLARDLEVAVTHFDRALEIDPGNLLGRLGRAAALIDLNRDDEALSDIDAVREIAPNHPLAFYLSAMAAAKNRDYDMAESELQELSRYLDDHMPSLFLRGAVNYAQNHLEQAENNLRRVVAEDPGNIDARKLLGATLVRKSEPDKALEALLPIMDIAPNDAQALALLGSAYMQKRDFTESTAYFERAIAEAPDTMAIRTQLALSRLAIGESSIALDSLQSVFDSDAGAVQAGILLALGRLREGDYDAVIEATRELEARQPDNPLVLNVRGAALVGKENVAEARRSFERALEIEPDYFPAQMNLAQLDLRDGNIASARQRFESIVARNPGYAAALVALAELELRENRPDRAAAWLEKARQANPRAVAPRLRLVNLYLAAGNPDKALAVARELEDAGIRSPLALEALARSQFASGAANNAVSTYRRLVKAEPESAEVHYRLAVAQSATGDDNGARRSLATARSLNPLYLPARVAAVELELKTGRLNEALDQARAITRDVPDIHVGDMLAGDALVAAGRHGEALAAYDRARARSDSATVALRRYNAHLGAGDIDTALASLAEWVDAHPDDRGTSLALANAYLRAGRRDESILRHEALLADDPENPVILNNLAWLYMEAGDSRALGYATRAYDAAPNSIAIADTLGWIMVLQGDAERALGLLSRATAAAPDAAEIRYHMAVALNDAGRHKEARRELEKVVASGDSFEAMGDARALLRQLSGG